MLAFRKLRSAGDTIVEVLMAIAIVSFVLMAAYVTANRNTLTNQDTQERAQALQLGTTQLEFLRSTSVGTNKCFDSTGTPVGTAGDNSPCVVGADGVQATPSTQPAYTILITPGPGLTSTVTVSWDSLVNRGLGNVTLYYQP